MDMKTKRLVVFGYGARGRIYSAFAQKYPEKFELVAIIENNPERLENAKNEYINVPAFSDYHDLFTPPLPNTYHNLKYSKVLIFLQTFNEKKFLL